jgi:hypothetical protein
VIDASLPRYGDADLSAHGRCWRRRERPGGLHSSAKGSTKTALSMGVRKHDAAINDMRDELVATLHELYGRGSDIVASHPGKHTEPVQSVSRDDGTLVQAEELAVRITGCGCEQDGVRQELRPSDDRSGAIAGRTQAYRPEVPAHLLIRGSEDSTPRRRQWSLRLVRIWMVESRSSSGAPSSKMNEVRTPVRERLPLVCLANEELV